MYRSSPFRSTWNTGYITGLDMCKVHTEAVHCAALWTSVQVQTNVIIPTPPHPTLSHVMCAGVTLGGKMVQNCVCVYLWLQCVRGWLWKMAVCARDSSLCARVTLGGKNDAKLCLCVLVTPECVRGWPPDLRNMPGCLRLWSTSTRTSWHVKAICSPSRVSLHHSIKLQSNTLNWPDWTYQKHQKRKSPPLEVEQFVNLPSP